MQTFKEWLEINDPELYSEINWRNAIGGALTGAAITAGGMGLIPKTNIQTHQPAKQTQVMNKQSNLATSHDAKDFLTNSNQGFNSQIGKFTAHENPDGTFTYKTVKGDFIMKKDFRGQPKYARIK